MADAGKYTKYDEVVEPEVGDAEGGDAGSETGEEGAEGAATKAAPGSESRALKFLNEHHPECRLDYQENVLLNLDLKSHPPVADTKHRSVPYLTLFEKTKIIGFRANQIARGARPFIDIPPHVTDVLEIARMELEQRRLPFILKRPMPDNTYEYWRLEDLMIL